MSKKNNFYLIRYSDSSNLYLGPDDSWIKDPRIAVRFTKDQGIHQIGRLLVEQEWVTKLVPLDQVPQALNPEPPNNFVVICDVNGEAQCCRSCSTLMENIFNLIRDLDKENPKNAPHAAWMSGVGGFSRLYARLVDDQK